MTQLYFIILTIPNLIMGISLLFTTLIFRLGLFASFVGILGGKEKSNKPNKEYQMISSSDVIQYQAAIHHNEKNNEINYLYMIYIFHKLS